MANTNGSAGDFSFDRGTAMDLSEAIARKKQQQHMQSDRQPERQHRSSERPPERRQRPQEHRYPAEQQNVRRSSTAAHTNGSAKKRRKKKKKSIIGPIIGIIVTLAVITGVAYLAGWSSSMGTFLKNTYIDDIDVSGMTQSQAIMELSKKYEAPKVKITAKSGNVVTLDLADFSYNTDVSAPVKKIFDEQDYSKWYRSYFENSNYSLATDSSFDKVHFERQLRRTTWSTTDTTDARIAYGDDGYYIVPEVYGDNVDLDKLVDYVMDEVNHGNFEIDLSNADLYTEPKVKTSDLQSELDNIKANFDFIITYDFDYCQEYLTGAEVYAWTDHGKDVDRRKVEGFVENLAKKYDTFMTDRHFTTTDGRNITISQGRYSTGQYGWWMDQEKTVEKLLEYIENGQSVTVDPIYVQLDTGYTYEGFEHGRSKDGDIGDTYIEIDLSAQHLWYYQDGELKFETLNIVSGKATDPNRKTPGGIYSVYTKSTNYTMVAPDNSYRAKCSYFMRLSFEGIGLHDLSRGQYGGNTYINNGSHGCINMKYSEVQTLYNMVERGTPAILYY